MQSPCRCWGGGTAQSYPQHLGAGRGAAQFPHLSTQHHPERATECSNYMLCSMRGSLLVCDREVRTEKEPASSRDRQTKRTHTTGATSLALHWSWRSRVFSCFLSSSPVAYLNSILPMSQASMES